MFPQGNGGRISVTPKSLGFQASDYMALSKAQDGTLARPCAFVNVGEVRYFNHNHLKPLSLSTLTYP